MKIRNELVNSGRASTHHVLPESGWVSYWIERGEEDIPAVIELFKIRYEQFKPRSQPKQEESNSSNIISATTTTIAEHYQQAVSEIDK